VKHTTGIPHSPMGQAIVERAHGTLKAMLQKQKRGSEGYSPQECINKMLYVLNFLNRDKEGKSPMLQHLNLPQTSPEKAWVEVKDPGSGQWGKPVQLI
ncbi:IGEB protein, partial [Nothocercus nigrocapillus]|nr:IGEB protein [Nothocercus nigrocapillus]